MLTRRDRGWSMVRESLRRERRISDLLNASNAARRARRVAVGSKDREWALTERAIRALEHDVRRLDPSRLDFWTAYADLTSRLGDAYEEAGIAFDPGR